MNLKSLQIKTSETVYTPIEDSYFLADHISDCKNLNVLDMCCGSGIHAITACSKNAQSVTAVDINPNAINLTKINAMRNDFSEKINAICGDMYTPLTEKYDLIISNPPYLPTPKLNFVEALNETCNGGFFGGALISRLIQGAKSHLKKNGELLFVQSSLANIENTFFELDHCGFEVKEIIKKSGIEFGPYSMRRLDYLKKMHNIEKSVFTYKNGKYYETLYVVKASLKNLV